MAQNRRKLSYRKLLNTAEEIHENNTGETSAKALNDVRTILKKTNKYLKSDKPSELVTSIDEVYLDAKLVSTITDVLKDAVDSIDLNADAYVEDDFADKLLEYLKVDEDVDWEKLEEDAITVFNPTPSYTFLYGTFEHVAPERPQREKKTREKLTQCAKKSPEKVTNLEKVEEGVSETVKTMHSILRELYKENDRNPISYYDFIIDPDNFSQTLENTFHFAFLIHDGAVRITTDDCGKAMVAPNSKSKHSHDKKDSLNEENVQKVMSLDMDDWEKIIETFNITECLYLARKNSR